MTEQTSLTMKRMSAFPEETTQETDSNIQSQTQPSAKPLSQSATVPTTTTTTTTTTTANFLEHVFPGRGQRNLRRILRQDPQNGLASVQQTHSLHSMFAQAFGTVPQYQWKKKRSSPETSTTDPSNNKRLKKNEPFRPDPALQFLSHLGVSTLEVHRRIGEALCRRLEKAVRDAGEKNQALLIKAWEAKDVPELRPVLVAVIRALGDKTPNQLLERLAEPKHADLLQQFGRDMARRVWEADWDCRSSGQKLLETVIDPFVQKYCTDPILVQASRQVAVTNVGDRRVHTQARRSLVAAASTSTISSSAVSTAGLLGLKNKKDDKCGEEETPENQPGAATAVTQIKDVIGGRPKLLGAVLQLLMNRHLLSQSSEDHTLSENPHLVCTLVSDVLLTYGKTLPRHYEYLGLLASVLDAAVRAGILSDDAVAQIQGCLRILFKDKEKDSSNNTNKGTITKDSNAVTPKDPASSTSTAATTTTTTTTKSITTKLTATTTKKTLDPKKKTTTATISTLMLKKKTQASSNNKLSHHPNKKSKLADRPKKYNHKEDMDYVRNLLYQVIRSATDAMKAVDSKAIFHHPVTDAIAPGYSRVISKPMCIFTIHSKNEAKAYKNLSDFDRDVQLMFANCVKYNVGEDGKWYRGEALRQKGVYDKNIYAQAKDLFKDDLAERKRKKEAEYEAQWAKAHPHVKIPTKSTSTTSTVQSSNKANVKSSTTKIPSAKTPTTKTPTSTTSTSNKTGTTNNKTNTAPNKPNTASTAIGKLVSEVTAGLPNKKEEKAIARLTAADLSPLPPSLLANRISCKEPNSQKKEHPNAAVLATMMLHDPLVIRIILEKIYRTLRVQVKNPKTTKWLPSQHSVLPSLLQIHRLAFSSSSSSKPKDSWENSEKAADFLLLRTHLPRYTQFLLSLHLDQRRAKPSGDLSEVEGLEALPLTCSPQKSSSLLVVAPLHKYAIHHLFVSSSQEGDLAAALPAQLERFRTVLSPSLLRTDRSFWTNLLHTLLACKRKLLKPPAVRDLITEFWLHYLESEEEDDDDDNGDNTTSLNSHQLSLLCAPVHELFIHLINEWATLGNLLPRDKQVSLATAAVEKVSKKMFASAWIDDAPAFSELKREYERLLQNVGSIHANQWRKKIGIPPTNNKKEEPTTK